MVYWKCLLNTMCVGNDRYYIVNVLTVAVFRRYWIILIVTYCLCSDLREWPFSVRAAQ